MELVTKSLAVRLPEGLEEAARERHPRLAGLTRAALIRAALAALAGLPLTDAVRVAQADGFGRGHSIDTWPMALERTRDT